MPSTRTLALVPLAVVPLLVVTAAPAHAVVTSSFTGGFYFQSGDAAGNSHTVACASGVVVPAPSVGTTPAPCGDVTSVRVNPGPGADSVDLSAVTAAAFPAVTRVAVDSDDFERDDVIGSPLDDVFTGDSDDIILGGAGNDRFQDEAARAEGGAGDDVFVDLASEDGVFGGPGDDRFVDTLAQGGTDGGTGEDTMDLDFNAASIDDSFEFTFTAAQLGFAIPGEGSQSLFLTGIEHLFLTLPGLGTQTLDLSAWPGDAVVRGFGGTDVLIGSKKSDILRGGSGNDTIDARDGGFDIVDCGSGADTAQVDPVDRVSGCESVTYVKPSTGKIKGPKKIAKGKSAGFTFTSSAAGSAFQCRIDSKKWRACSSPYQVSTRKLSVGKHVLRVRAGFPVGNWDTTPSKKAFTVTR